MSKLTTASIEDATQLDLKIGGNDVLRLTADGSQRMQGMDLNWFVDLIGDHLAIGGSGALAQAVLSIGSFRKYNAWEFINHASNNPFLDLNFWLPPGYDGRPLKGTLYFVKTATATGTDIVTNLRLVAIGEGDSLDSTVSASGLNVVTTVGANNCLFTVEHDVTPNNAADGGLCHGLIQRLPTNASDDYTGSVYLIGARIEFA